MALYMGNSVIMTPKLSSRNDKDPGEHLWPWAKRCRIQMDSFRENTVYNIHNASSDHGLFSCQVPLVGRSFNFVQVRGGVKKYNKRQQLNPNEINFVNTNLTMLRCQPWCQWQHQCWWQHRRQHRWDLQWVLRWRCWIHGWPVASCRIHGKGMEGWRGRGTWQQVTSSLYNINYIAQQHFRHHTKRQLDQSSAFDEKHLRTLTSSSFSNLVGISMIFQETSMTRRKPFFAYRLPEAGGVQGTIWQSQKALAWGLLVTHVTEQGEHPFILE